MTTSGTIVRVLACRVPGCTARGEIRTTAGEDTERTATVVYTEGWSLDSKSEDPPVPTHGWCPAHQPE